MTERRSERASLAAILTMVNVGKRAAQRTEASGGDVAAVDAVLRAFEAIEEEARALQGQVQRGVHVNPPLVVFGNPPLRARRRTVGTDMVELRVTLAGLIGDQVDQIKYRHADDGKPYVHDFERDGTGMWAGTVENWTSGRRRIVVLLNDRHPLWKDF